jgi:hypothetical protein
VCVLHDQASLLFENMFVIPCVLSAVDDDDGDEDVEAPDERLMINKDARRMALVAAKSVADAVIQNLNKGPVAEAVVQVIAVGAGLDNDLDAELAAVEKKDQEVQQVIHDLDDGQLNTSGDEQVHSVMFDSKRSSHAPMLLK